MKLSLRVLEAMSSCFQLENAQNTIEIDPKQEACMQVLFSPNQMQAFHTSLVLEPSVNQEKYKIHLLGFGGASHIEVVQPESSLLDMGICYEGIPKKFSFSMRNTGSRAGFIRIVAVSSDSRTTIEPEATCIPPGGVQDFKVTYTAERGDSTVEGWSSPYLTVEILVGDEVLRQIGREFRLLQDETFPLLSKLDQRFIGEDLMTEENFSKEILSRIPRDELITIVQANVQCLPLTCYGLVQKLIPKMETKEQPLPYPSRVSPPRVASGNPTLSRVNKSDSSDRKLIPEPVPKLAITPKNLIIFGESTRPTTTFSVINATSSLYAFQIRLYDSRLFAMPLLGTVGPYSEVEITVGMVQGTFFDSKLENFASLATWSSSFVVAYQVDNSQDIHEEIVHVCIQGSQEVISFAYEA